MESLCKSSSFKLQTHQIYLKNAIHQMNDRVLLYHGLGSGKTCSAISIANGFKTSNPNAKIIVITPASIKPNFYKEMSGPCGAQFKELEYDTQNNIREENPCRSTGKNLIKNERARQLKQQKKVDNIIQLMSYQQFVNQLNTVGIDFKNTLVIVDEVQNIISAGGSMYKTFLYHFVTNRSNNNDKMKLILLSGTPVFDDVFELALLGNLLRVRGESSLPTDRKTFHNRYKVSETDGRITNEEELVSFFSGKVSHYRGANPIAYPKRRDHGVNCVMSDFQRKLYETTVGNVLNCSSEMSQCFLVAPRQTSNVVYPNNKIDAKTASKYEGSNLPFSSKKHSCKFHQCMNKIEESDGSVFVYSNFVRACGIYTFAHFLEKERGYTRITPDICPLLTKNRVRRFAIFKTGEPIENSRILDIFNSFENRNGDLIKAILGSPAMKEGVSLLRVSQVHLLDPYWNQSREEQVIGRAIRFCSHKDVPVNKRVVDVFRYYAVVTKSVKNKISNTDLTVDLHIKQLSSQKQVEISAFERLLKESAFDCQRFKRFNEPPVINCKQSSANLPNNNANNNVNNNASNNPTKPTRARASVSMLRKKTVMRKIRIDGQRRKTQTQEQTKSRAKNLNPKVKKTRDNRTSCPVDRRPLGTGICPSTHPHKRPNKNGDACCYKRRATSSVKSCVQTYDKNTLKQMAVLKRLYNGTGPITKKTLCGLLAL